MSLPRLAATLCAAFTPLVFAENSTPDVQGQIDALKADYEQRLQALEQQRPPQASLTERLHLDLGIVLDGRLGAYNNPAEDYELPGFALGGEAGLAGEGFSLGHSEIGASASIDDKFHGKMTLAVAEHDGETEVELEEAFIETLGLGAGFTLRGGRFFSAIGYLNQQHEHTWDFADAPLVYAGLWGNKYIDDGVRLAWLAPLDIFLEVGAEALSGGQFPAGGERSNGVGAQTAFLNLGSDIGNSHSWQAGLSYFTAKPQVRESGGHDHDGAEETPAFSGDSEAWGASLVYKWAPDGNYKNTHFKLQAEYFSRDEEGNVELLDSDPLETTTYCGEQRGYYVQGIYQFLPQWRAGLRHDAVYSRASGMDSAVLEESGLDNEGIKPKRNSFMVEWLPSEFSRVRLQFNRDKSYEAADQQIILQYTMSLGAHGAHSF